MTCPRCAVSWPHLHVTDVLKRAGLMDTTWASPEAMTRGSYVHAAIALGDDLDDTSLDPVLMPYVAAYRRWLAESGADILMLERFVAYKALGYCGTLDCIARINGQQTLIDFKSGGIPESVGPQTAAYKLALFQAGPPAGTPSQLKRACLQLKSDGTYRWHELNDRRDTDIWKAALAVASWQVARGIAA